MCIHNIYQFSLLLNSSYAQHCDSISQHPSLSQILCCSFLPFHTFDLIDVSSRTKQTVENPSLNAGGTIDLKVHYFSKCNEETSEYRYYSYTGKAKEYSDVQNVSSKKYSGRVVSCESDSVPVG